MCKTPGTGLALGACRVMVAVSVNAFSIELSHLEEGGEETV